MTVFWTDVMHMKPLLFPEKADLFIYVLAMPLIILWVILCFAKIKYFYLQYLIIVQKWCCWTLQQINKYLFCRMLPSGCFSGTMVSLNLIWLYHFQEKRRLENFVPFVFTFHEIFRKCPHRRIYLLDLKSAKIVSWS